MTVSLSAALLGEARKVDGSIYQGEIRLEEGGFAVLVDETNPVHVVLEQLTYLRCEQVPEEMLLRPQGGGGLEGTYFEKMDFSGKSYRRLDEAIDFAWGSGSPHGGLGPDNFSVRWEGQLALPAAGKYAFYMVTDDGGRLWIDDRLLIDQWRDQSASEGRAELDLAADQKHRLKMEYYERSGEAVARLFWSGPSLERQIIGRQYLSCDLEAAAGDGSHGLVGSYYRGTKLEGAPKTRRDPQVDFDWGGGAPMEGLGSDDFSVRWEAKLTPLRTASYTFQLETDDGVRLWIDDQQVVDAWREGTFEVKSQAVDLQAGQFCNLRLEYYERGGGAKIRLFWSAPDQGKTLVPSELFSPLGPRKLTIKPLLRSTKLSPGIILTSGTCIARPVYAADPSEVRFSNNQRDRAYSTMQVARILFQNLALEAMGKVEPERTGLLLESGDFIDGEFESYQHGRVQINSVLFGLRSFERYRVRAVFLREIQPVPATFEVRTRDGSCFRVDTFAVSKDGLSLASGPVAPLVLPASDLVEINRL